jgi:hypothetical protein
VRLNLVFVSLLAAVCVYSWWKGGGPERIGAAIFAAGSALTHLLLAAPAVRWRSLEHGVLAVDTIGFLAFLLLALCAHRFWPLWVTGLLGVALVGHLAKLFSPGVIPWAYHVILSIWSYPILAIMVCGTWLHQRRVRKFGSDRSWSTFCARRGPARPEAGRTG